MSKSLKSLYKSHKQVVVEKRAESSILKKPQTNPNSVVNWPDHPGRPTVPSKCLWQSSQRTTENLFLNIAFYCIDSSGLKENGQIHIKT